LRRHLRVTTLHALEEIAGSGATAGELVAEAGDAATELRTFVSSLAAAEGRTAIAELRRQIAGLRRSPVSWSPRWSRSFRPRSDGASSMCRW
jgi:hypothetical protein